RLQWLAGFGERRALVVGKPESTRDVAEQDSIFGAQVFALEEQTLINRAVTNASNRAQLLFAITNQNDSRTRSGIADVNFDRTRAVLASCVADLLTFIYTDGEYLYRWRAP